MLVTVLIDNLTSSSLLFEWGFSVCIEYKEHLILLDTGASDAFARNAEALGISLADISFGVLSHAHYDHANGLRAFFERNASAPFYLRAGSKENCYKKLKFFYRYIGIKKGFLQKYRNRILYADNQTTPMPGVHLLSHTCTGLSAVGQANRLYIKKHFRFLPDDFSHEQSLILETEKGLVIFNSCSHGGADQIIREVSEAFPNQPVYALIGGFHLYRQDRNAVLSLAQRIKQTGIQKIYTGHCTGTPAFEILREVLGDTVVQLTTGMKISL